MTYINPIEDKYRKYVEKYLHLYTYGWSELVNEIRGGIDIAILKSINPSYILISKLAYCVLTLHLWETNQLDRDVLPTYYSTNYSQPVRILIDEYGLLDSREQVVVIKNIEHTTLWSISDEV